MLVAMSKLRKGLVLSLVLSVGLTCFGCSLLNNSKASSPTAKSITSFAITSPVAATGTINQDYTIDVTVPSGTIVTSMVATFEYDGASVSVNGTNQVSGVTANDFTNSKTYTVTAEDGSTQNYVVTVTIALSTTKDITSFKIISPAATATISGTTITVTVPYNTTLTNLIASFTHNGSSIVIGSTPQISGTTANDFTGMKTYTVTAADGSTKNYYVTVNTASAAAKALTSFKIQSPSAVGVINETAGTIAVEVPSGTAVTALVAEFETTGQSVKVGSADQVSGMTPNDFTSPVTYIVTAYDASPKNYVVTVSFTSVVSTWTNPASGYASYLIDAPESEEFQYKINLGSSTKDVYFIFTNTSLSSAVTAPVTLANTAPSFLSSIARSFSISQKSSAEPVAQRGTPEITEFNRDPFGHLGISKNAYSRNVMIRPEPPLYDTVGGTMSFMNESTSDLIPSTCRKAVTVDGYTMYIYVADDCWTGGTKANLVTQAMVDAVAGKFLVSGNADIFHWVRNVFGAHWGTHSYSNMIGATTDITILLYDIDGDNSTTGGTCGFFWSKDLFNTTSVSYSNQRAMFYIDAVMLATKEDTTWEISDYWPSQMISTLAHEFQHMIHFYQKAIVRTGGTNSESWINEMCAMSAEDLVADKIQVDGPRAVAYTDPTAGSSGIVSGRVSMFNYYPEYSVASWDTGSNVLFDYAIKYVLGAYYGRNYGGAAFFQNIIQNSYTDYRAIEWALTQAGSSDTFTASLRKWFVSVLLSDKTNTDAGYGYNKAAWYTSTLNAITYNLGSMNFFNYYQHDGSAAGSLGVYVNTSVVDLNPSSSFIYKAGTGVTGAQSWPVTLKPGIKMTVVVK